MSQSIQKIAVSVLIASVVVLTFLAILAIWDVLSDDIFWKSISTIGVVAFAALIVVVAAKSIDHFRQPPL